MLHIPILKEGALELVLGDVKEAAHVHAEVAHSSGKSLRDHLEACADLQKDGR